MRDLTIDELILALDDLLGKRGPELAKLSSGKSFRTLLSRIRGQLAALPEALRGLPRRSCCEPSTSITTGAIAR